jgi:hypothetical protein
MASLLPQRPFIPVPRRISSCLPPVRFAAGSSVSPPRQRAAQSLRAGPAANAQGVQPPSDLGILQGSCARWPCLHLIDPRENSRVMFGVLIGGIGTFIMPTGANLPSLFVSPRQRLRLEYRRLKQHTQDFFRWVSILRLYVVFSRDEWVVCSSTSSWRRNLDRSSVYGRRFRRRWRYIDRCIPL